MKKVFKKQGVIDTVTNVGIGGAANVAMDYAVSKIDALASLGQTTINAIKIGVGVLGGTMTTNKMLRAATDGIAVVGVANLVQGLLDGTTETPASGLAKGTIGRAPRMGNRVYRRHVAGVADGFMGK